jgi:hypothetical protein
MIKNFRRLTAQRFYDSIKNKSEYKLINGLFIVKYLGKGIYKYVGNFNRKGSVRATPKTSYVDLSSTKQLFNPKRRETTTSLGVWTKLNIGFRIKPISEVLK